MILILITIFVSIVGTIINYLILNNDIKEGKAKDIKLEKKRISRNLIFLQAGTAIIAGLIAGYISWLDNNQKDRIEQYQILSNNLDTQVLKLGVLNKNISNKIDSQVLENNFLETENIGLTDSIHKLMYVVNNLISSSHKTINEIQRGENQEFSKNAVAGTLHFDDFSKKDTVHLIIGNYITELPFHINFKSPELTIGNASTGIVAELSRKNGKFFISTSVVDSNNRFILRIDNNKWRVNPDFKGKINYDKHGLEILDDHRYPIFNIDISKNIIKVQGFFYEQNYLLIAERRTVEKYILPVSQNDLNNGRSNIKILFDYTDVDYIGKRVKN